MQTEIDIIRHTVIGQKIIILKNIAEAVISLLFISAASRFGHGHVPHRDRAAVKGIQASHYVQKTCLSAAGSTYDADEARIGKRE